MMKALLCFVFLLTVTVLSAQEDEWDVLDFDGIEDTKPEVSENSGKEPDIYDEDSVDDYDDENEENDDKDEEDPTTAYPKRRRWPGYKMCKTAFSKCMEGAGSDCFKKFMCYRKKGFCYRSRGRGHRRPRRRHHFRLRHHRGSHRHPTVSSEMEPCFSNPCLNGGTCIPNMADGTYRCNCPKKILGVPYLDHHCAIDRSLLIKTGTFRNVFHLRIKDIIYPMNYYDAERACAIYGAQMSSLKQLVDAWRVGFDYCSYGWLIDGTVRYPIYNQRTRSGCGGTGPPSIRGSNTLKNKLTARFHVYCYRETDDCQDEDWHQNGNTCYKFFLTAASRNAAIAACALEGAVLGVSNSINKIGFIRDFLQRSNFTGNQILVGLQQGADGTWKWIDGGVVQSSLWKVTQPTGPIGTVNTVMGSLDNVPDSDQWKLPFVCQKQVP